MSKPSPLNPSCLGVTIPSRWKAAIPAMQHVIDNILVECPACGLDAQVRSGVRLQCSNCAMVQQRNHARKWAVNGTSYEGGGIASDWHGAFILLEQGPNRCRKCGSSIRIGGKTYEAGRRPAQSPIVEIMECPGCRASNEITLHWVPLHLPSSPRDPYFGAALSLSVQTAKGVLWAFNHDHVAALRRFIEQGTDYREDDSWPTFARLPGWIKSAKNRTLVLKSLAKMNKSR